jgi:hypothetical protein
VLPHRAAGANSAIEDAEALGELSCEVPAALELVFLVRFKRVTRYQLLSGRGHKPASVTERDYLGAKEWDCSSRRFLTRASHACLYRMPWHTRLGGRALERVLSERRKPHRDGVHGARPEERVLHLPLRV